MYYLQKEEELKIALDYLKDSPQLAADTETYCIYPELYGDKGALSPHGGRVSILTIQKREEEPLLIDIYAYDKRGVDLKELWEKLAQCEYIVWANAKFDIQMLRSHMGFFLENSRCVVQLSYLISNATGSKFGKVLGHSLKDLCRDYLSIPLSKGIERVSDWGLPMECRNLENPEWYRKLLYAEQDVRYLFPLHDLMMETLTHPLINMEKIALMECENIINIASMEYDGLPVSRSLLRKFNEAIQRRLEEVGVKLCHKFNLETGTYGSIFDDEEKELPTAKSYTTLNNPESVRYLMEKHLPVELRNTQSRTLERLLEIMESLTKGNNPDYSSEDEEMFYEELHYLDNCRLVELSEMVQLVLEYKALLKQVGSDLERYIDPVTGRIHCTYNGLGGATGRMSSANPNAQQVSVKTPVEIEFDLEDYIW